MTDTNGWRESAEKISAWLDVRYPGWFDRVDTESLKQDAIEVKRLALSHQRTKVLQAVESDDTETVMLLGLPSSASSTVTDAEWIANDPSRY